MADQGMPESTPIEAQIAKYPASRERRFSGAADLYRDHFRVCWLSVFGFRLNGFG
jgi:hypothetical protein